VLTCERPQHILWSSITARIPLRMNQESCFDWTNVQRLRAGEQPPQSEFVVLSRRQHDEVLHPNTPAARSVPRLTSCFQSLSAGCWSPRTMSVWPSGVFAKHSTSCGSTRLRITGECVAKRICALYTDFRD